ncbi:MAG: hypothetical protein DMF15_15405 [Verrucomicrobia bacterium]|nr:MAG: hypothetical protein DMF15_15405 [Verrucomicrobiota bacterium]
MGRLFSIVFARAARGEVSELVRQPITKGFVDIMVGVDEDGPTGQVSENGAGVTRGHMQVKDASVINVLPVRHEEDPEGKNGGLHDLNLSSDKSFLLRAGTEDDVAVWRRCRGGRITANQVGAAICLSPRELSKSQEEENRPNCEFHLPPPGAFWRRRWGFPQVGQWTEA